jgi:protein-tyrosine-phosphatase
MPDPIYNVLFICTGNSARSILAESILQRDGAGRFRAFSAGSQPKGEVNPLALKTLQAWDYPAEGFRSKSWEEFAVPGAPVMDFVFTVCDNAAGETCPVWPGQPMTAHWGIEDPAAVEGSEVEKLRALNMAFRYMKIRISLFTALPIRSLDAMALGTKLKEIVISPLGVKLCRPSEAVLDLLPSPQQAAFTKEDGERVVDASGRRVAPAGLKP